MLVQLRVEPGPVSGRGRSDPQPGEPLIAHPQPLPARPPLTPVRLETRRSRPRHTDYEKAVTRRAIDYQRQGLDLLLTGQSPLGEVLATPSATELNGIAVCLVDVEDDLRRARLRLRDGSKWSSDQEQAFVNWGAWHRGHASDPQHQPEVIVGDGDDSMRWERWTGWAARDHRWLTSVIDTSSGTVDSCVGEVVRWVERCRVDHASGHLPLKPGWVDRPVEP